MSAEVVRDASNALVVAAEASRTSATAFARMLSESEAEREKLVAALVKSEAAYAGVLTNLEAVKQGVVKDSSELVLLRELERLARAWSRGAPNDQGVLAQFANLFDRLSTHREPR